MSKGQLGKCIDSINNGFDPNIVDQGGKSPLNTVLWLIYEHSKWDK